MELNWFWAGIFLMVLTNFLIFQDMRFESQFPINTGDNVVTATDFAKIIITEQLDPFIYTLGGASALCFIAAFLVWVNKKFRRENHG